MGGGWIQREWKVYVDTFASAFIERTMRHHKSALLLGTIKLNIQLGQKRSQIYDKSLRRHLTPGWII